MGEQHDRREGEKDPIGLILCGSRGEQVVELLLSSQTNRMKVAQYLLPADTAAYEQLPAGVVAGPGIRPGGPRPWRWWCTGRGTYPSPR